MRCEGGHVVTPSPRSRRIGGDAFSFASKNPENGAFSADFADRSMRRA